MIAFCSLQLNVPPIHAYQIGYGGGVAIYVREGINATKRSDLSINGI